MATMLCDIFSPKFTILSIVLMLEMQIIPRKFPFFRAWWHPISYVVREGTWYFRLLSCFIAGSRRINFSISVLVNPFVEVKA
jgi:hypothetical protein